VANARRRVRFISRSLSASMYWLNAPALAEETSTVSAITSTCQTGSPGAGVMASPARAVSMISRPMRSLNTPSTTRHPGAALTAAAACSAVLIGVLPERAAAASLSSGPKASRGTSS